MAVWKTLNYEELYPYYVERIQHLEQMAYNLRLQFCRWSNTRPYCVELFYSLMKFSWLFIERIIRVTQIRGRK
jgi:hypothetical protein